MIQSCIVHHLERRSMYYTIIAKADKGDKWSPQFGDHVKRVVQQERSDSYLKHHGWHSSMILTTQTDSVQDVMQAMAKLY